MKINKMYREIKKKHIELNEIACTLDYVRCRNIQYIMCETENIIKEEIRKSKNGKLDWWLSGRWCYMKRSGKFYRKNEAEVMKALGLKPTKNSGSGWVWCWKRRWAKWACYMSTKKYRCSKYKSNSKRYTYIGK